MCSVLTGGLLTFFRPWVCCAYLAAMATVLKRQKPMHDWRTAWCPGGRQMPNPAATSLLGRPAAALC